MEDINKGTIEYVPVQVLDRLGGIETLDGFDITFRVDDEAGENTIVNWTTCSSDGMTVLPLINANSPFEKATYRLYVKIEILPEIPILGPYLFQVI